MGSKRDRWHVGAASATISAGAIVFLATGAGPAAAESPATGGTSSGECKLPPLLCKILGGGTGTTSPSSSPSHSSAPKPAPKHTTRPKPKTQPRPKARPAHSHARHTGSGTGTVIRPEGGALPAGHGQVPPISVSRQAPPALPDITAQDPVVLPGQTADGRAQRTPTRLVAADSPAETPMPPLLVATASGLIGAVTALNLSMLSRQVRRRR